MTENVKVALKGNPHQYEIKIGNDLLRNSGSWAKYCLANTTQKIVIISNPKVFSLYGETVAESLQSEGFDVLIHKIGDGEKYKSLRTLENTLKFFSQNKLKRSDAVIALGGGVVGDLAGFASAVYLRGIAFLQIPTTFLSMIDSSVGGKTGVNSDFGKNLIGAFHQPNGVLIDVTTLKTLPRRELTAGFCEAVKQGVIANQQLFMQTADFLKNYSRKKLNFSNPDLVIKLQKLIAAQVAFKAEIVRADERENLDKMGSSSRKILNFGHTVGHALEKITDYKYFKHGEAVGLGMLVAGELSKRVANFVQNELNLLNDVVFLTGNLPNCQHIETEKVVEALAFDKKNVGNSLQWILLSAIGSPKIVDGGEISSTTISEAIKAVLKTKPAP